MFGLFKKRASGSSADGPHPQHRNFARMSIPDALTRVRSGFLVALSDARASQILQESWQKFGAAVLPSNALMPPTGLSVSGFRQDKHLGFLILFPPPKAPGESFFGLILAGPSDDWSPEVREKVPVRYFLLERASGPSPTIFEWRPSGTRDEEAFESHGAGPSPQYPPDFVDVILARFYGVKPDA